VPLVLLLLASVVVNAKDCVFLHGTGVTSAGPPTSTFPEYWGEVQTYTTQCDSNIFNHADTVDYAFDSQVLMQSYCSVCTDGFTSNKTESGVSLIQNKIIFTHSMGNDILAAAIKNGYCDFDLSSSTWYEVSGPMHGSKATLFLEQICAGNASAVLIWLAKELNYCVNGHMSPAHQSLVPSYPGLNGLSQIIAARISGAMCGIDPFGLFSKYSIPMEALSDLVKYGEPDDGMVGISSCDVIGSFGSSYTDPFFAGKLNHADATCRNGGVPCNWYGARK